GVGGRRRLGGPLGADGASGGDGVEGAVQLAGDVLERTVRAGLVELRLGPVRAGAGGGLDGAGLSSDGAGVRGHYYSLCRCCVGSTYYITRSEVCKPQPRD